MQISAKFVNNCHYSVKQWHTLVFVKVSIYFFVTVFLQNSTVQCLSVCINLMRCFLLDCIFYEILYICVFVFHTLSGDCFLYRFFIVLFGLTSFYVCVIVLSGFHVDCPIIEIQYGILVLSHKCSKFLWIWQPIASNHSWKNTPDNNFFWKFFYFLYVHVLARSF